MAGRFNGVITILQRRAELGCLERLSDAAPADAWSRWMRIRTYGGITELMPSTHKAPLWVSIIGFGV
jgi:hypothetical protein